MPSHSRIVHHSTNCFLGVSCALLSRLTSAKHRFRAPDSRNGHLRRLRGVWRPPRGGASGGRSARRLQPTSPWPQAPPMHFLSLTEYNVGLSRPVDAVLTPFGSLFTFTPHPIRSAHDLTETRNPTRHPCECHGRRRGVCVCVCSCVCAVWPRAASGNRGLEKRG